MAYDKKTVYSSLFTGNRSRNGFTIIEIVVVLGITALLSSILISYNHTTRQQVSFYVDQMKFIQTIFRAKSLALSPSLQSSNSGICGYGVHVDYGAMNYFLFSCNMPQGTDCQSINSISACSQTRISTSDTDNNIRFISQSGTPRLDDVLFIPPDPITLVSSGGAVVSPGSASVIIQTKDGSLSSAPISVSSAGLIDF
mgnify:CR=1 FL=1